MSSDVGTDVPHARSPRERAEGGGAGPSPPPTQAGGFPPARPRVWRRRLISGGCCHSLKTGPSAELDDYACRYRFNNLLPPVRKMARLKKSLRPYLCRRIVRSSFSQAVFINNTRIPCRSRSHAQEQEIETRSARNQAPA
jgi:hypothetical protein